MFEKNIIQIDGEDAHNVIKRILEKELNYQAYFEKSDKEVYNMVEGIKKDFYLKISKVINEELNKDRIKEEIATLGEKAKKDIQNTLAVIKAEMGKVDISAYEKKFVKLNELATELKQQGKDYEGIINSLTELKESVESRMKGMPSDQDIKELRKKLEEVELILNVRKELDPTLKTTITQHRKKNRPTDEDGGINLKL